MSWSITRAAREAGLSKSTISRAIKAGRLSAGRQEDGTYLIDPAELFRVYPRGGAHPPDNPRHDAPRNPPEQPPATPLATEENQKKEIALLREMLDRERDTVEDLRKRLDLATERVLALTKVAQPPDNPVHDASRNPPQPGAQRGFWSWLRRG